MFYQILINGLELATVGHTKVCNMSLSLSIDNESPSIFASAVCQEDGDLYQITWLQNHIVSLTDVVEFKLVTERAVMEPIRKYRMRPANNYGIEPFPRELKLKIESSILIATHSLEIKNDDVTPMGYVVSLFQIKLEMNNAEAVQLMGKIHKEGKAKVLIGTEAIMSEVGKLIEAEASGKGFPLNCSVYKN